MHSLWAQTPQSTAFNSNVKGNQSVNVQQSSLESSDEEPETTESTKPRIKIRVAQLREAEGHYEANSSSRKNKTDSPRSDPSVQASKGNSSKPNHSNVQSRSDTD